MVGQTISHYRILDELGGGGMGIVYRAEDLRLQRIVAIKVLPPQVSRDRAAKDRFMQEARAASALDHQNICTVHAIEETPDGQLFLVMSYYEGETLRARLDRGRLPVDEAVGIAIQVASGLARAHARGIVHRDIKPANVMITPEGIAKILDFGLARLPDVTGASETGITWGTVAYMAPEQARGDTVDARTDLWAVGVLLYEMIAGIRPFRGETASAVIYNILHSAPESLAGLRAQVPPALDRIVARVLSKPPVERPQSAKELIADLRHVAKGESGPGGAMSTTGMVPARGQPSVAVLPFNDLSPEGDQDYFCDGMADELINALTAVPGVRVPSRTSSFQFKGKAVDISEIAGRLRVDTVLEGSVRKAGARLRITSQLVNAVDGYQLWSAQFNRDIDDVFAVQEEIARAIVDALKVKLFGAEAPLVRRSTSSSEAYRLYLKGRHYWTWRPKGFLGRALEHFTLAVGQDPGFALAYAGIADCYLLAGHFGMQPPLLVRSKALEAAERALALDPESAEVHHSMGAVRYFIEWDAPGAERAFARALDLNPKAALTYAYQALLLATMAGRFAEAQHAARRALELDPVSSLIGYLAGSMWLFADDPARAATELRRTLELDDRAVLAVWSLSLALSELGQHEEAVQLARRGVEVTGRQQFFLGSLALVLAAAGEAAEARSLLDEIQARSATEYVSPLHLAHAPIALGEHDRALDALERAYEERTVSLMSFLALPHFNPLRSHPRFARIAEALSLRRPTA